MLTFQREKLGDCRHEAEPLLRRHWQEIAHYPDIVYAPRWDAYETAESLDLLRIFTVRLDGLLVGYCVFCIARSMHYGDSLEAIEDVLFLAPEHRKGRVGLRLIEFSDMALRLDGVQVVKRHVKFAHDFGALLERLGYEPIDKLYGRRLDKE